jgi:hypothetical protein
MARWLDQLTENEEIRLKAMFGTIRDIKPKGWSVVWRINEISIRPSDRTVGRFSVIYSERHGFRIAFFSKSAGFWSESLWLFDDSTTANAIVRWMVHAACNPEERKDSHGA